MNETIDFEKAWLGKLSDALDGTAGEEARRQIMQGRLTSGAETTTGKLVLIRYTL